MAVAMPQPRCFNHRVNRRVVILNAGQPFLVNVALPRPDVPVAALQVAVRPHDAGRLSIPRVGDAPAGQQPALNLPLLGAQLRPDTVARERVVLGKGRVNANQVDALVVERPQKAQVVRNVHPSVHGIKTMPPTGLNPRPQLCRAISHNSRLANPQRSTAP